MERIGKWLKKFLNHDSGAEPVQYAVALALIIVAVVGGLQLLGGAANNQNNATSNMLQTASGSGGAPAPSGS
jgi:Flp pilus assembly pilin Flp